MVRYDTRAWHTQGLFIGSSHDMVLFLSFLRTFSPQDLIQVSLYDPVQHLVSKV